MSFLDWFVAPQRPDVANAVVAEPQQAVVKKPEVNTPKYSAKETSTGRAVLKTSASKTNYDPSTPSSDTRMSSEYKYDPNAAASEDWKKAPGMEQAFGMKPYGGGWKGALIEGGKNFLMTAIPTIVGGLAGGRKGAMSAYETALQNQMSNQAKRQAQLENVMSDPKLRTAYELARVDYEKDSNLGTPQGDFGFYLGEKLLGMEDKWGGGQLGTLIKLLGPEGGMAKYEELRQKRSSGGGGGGGGASASEVIFDPKTNRYISVRSKMSDEQLKELRERGRPVQTVTSKVGENRTTFKTAVPRASDFINRGN